MSKVTVSRPGYFRGASDRVQVPVAALRVGMRVLELDRPWTETPFLFQGFRIETLQQIEEISRYCAHVVVEYDVDLWIKPTERAVLGKSVRRRPSSDSPPPLRQNYESASRLQNDARALTRNMMDDVRLGRAINIEEVKATVSNAVKTIIDSPDAMIWLSRIRTKSEYTAEHCVNVGLLSINFGRHLGYGEDDLRHIGLAGMLHDVGKSLTPVEVLHKEGALNQEEFELMRAHTTDGRNILMAHRDAPYGSVDVAYAHHESLDGTGYPRKLKAAGISDMTRIVTICDVYDAITSDRCYRRGQPSLRALDVLNRESGKKFDARLVEEFVRCMGLYPTGSVVELKNGCHGIVTTTNHRNRHLPRVLLIRDEAHQPCAERILDLGKLSGQEGMEGWLIKTVVPNGVHGIRVEEYVRRGLHLQ
ncbi:MAG: HD-GYP domain-containing protein [Gammaproteobacteria bacterium]|nr:HD-GYP domain-containing protein [Gammaproteobacteria bacterium]MBP6051024.1 HD-GYP domain-containing protein [Pseudomonadales bacterium]MBK6582531.1 HD-GYP domain-containing protein [Gammaproteobacteria bacterium]MBK7521202.1 HD-GYP domain-containing protein [Gammaproteobacteria bacterium]MBK7728976.1 HD-GYP domain-containing protein [Gammaproteobacteria bacterium]